MRTGEGRPSRYFIPALVRRRGGGYKAAGLRIRRTMRERLVHVPFRGPIRERTVEPYVRLLRGLRGRRRVKGVLFDISSGGGEVVASTDLYLAVRRLNETVPVFASIGSLGASGGYLAALGARRVFAYAESLVGSIGVVYPHVAVRDLVRRLGVGVDLVHVGEHKDAFQGYRPLTEVERGKLLAVAQDDYEGFVRTVAEARRRSPEEIRALATGEVWSGARAHALGLVDALGDREVALEALAGEVGVPARRAVRALPPRPFLERMLAGGAQAFSASLAERVGESFDELLGLPGLRR
ncbi:MAG TPA: signal peptide peptidase SppA [Thermoplasmata archaeon]|nr:signal peptide peptidase SppA [Thermoplasmata archaeon]